MAQTSFPVVGSAHFIVLWERMFYISKPLNSGNRLCPDVNKALKIVRKAGLGSLFKSTVHNFIVLFSFIKLPHKILVVTS